MPATNWPTSLTPEQLEIRAFYSALTDSSPRCRACHGPITPLRIRALMRDRLGLGYDEHAPVWIDHKNLDLKLVFRGCVTGNPRLVRNPFFPTKTP